MESGEYPVTMGHKVLCNFKGSLKGKGQKFGIAKVDVIIWVKKLPVVNFIKSIDHENILLGLWKESMHVRGPNF